MSSEKVQLDVQNVSTAYSSNWTEMIPCDFMRQPPPSDGQLYCPAVFDGLLCWDYTPSGTVAKAECPHHIEKSFLPDEFAHKTCNEDGTWFRHPVSNRTWTDYTSCGENRQAEVNYHILIAGNAVSCVLLIISLIIFNSFRQLKCSRVVIHQHLFVSFILTGIMWIISYTKFLISPEVKEEHPTWCVVVHVITQYSSICNYFWMFCEGFFLHTIVVQAFSKQKLLLIVCCVIGWVLPIVPVIAYVIARALDATSNVSCWSHTDWTFWILVSPIILSLVLNLILLLNILRILLSKIRAFNTNEHNQNWRAVKATLILVPLLGLQNLITSVKPGNMDKQGVFIWDLISNILNSFQGAVVALIFCFFNGEVLAVLKRRWGQWRHNYDPAFLGRPSVNSTTLAMTLDDTSTAGAAFKNGSNRMTKASTRNAKDSTELQLMVPGTKA